MAGTSPAMTTRKGCRPALILQYLSSLFTLRLSRRPDPLPPAARSTSPLQGEVGSVPRCAVTSSVRSFPSAALRSWSAALPPPERGRAGEGVRICKAIDVRGRPSKFGVTRVVDFRRELSRPTDSSCPGSTRASTPFFRFARTWMAGTSPAMTMRKGCSPALKRAPVVAKHVVAKLAATAAEARSLPL